MTHDTHLQKDINSVWEGEWAKGGYSAKSLLTQRIFVEGYPVVKKYVGKDALRILDVGAATGRYSIQLAKDLPHATVYATDILESSLDIIRSLIKETGVANVVVEKQDALSLSFPDNSFDVVYSGMMIQTIPDVAQALREMNRVLKPGGTLIVSTVNRFNFHTIFKWYLKAFNRPREYYGEEDALSPYELAELFKRTGLQDIQKDGFYPAYGIYRLKMYWKPAALIGKILNRVNRIIDGVTGRWLSRQFGFEIFCVGKKVQ